MVNHVCMSWEKTYKMEEIKYVRLQFDVYYNLQLNCRYDKNNNSVEWNTIKPEKNQITVKDRTFTYNDNLYYFLGKDDNKETTIYAIEISTKNLLNKIVYSSALDKKAAYLAKDDIPNLKMGINWVNGNNTVKIDDQIKRYINEDNIRYAKEILKDTIGNGFPYLIELLTKNEKNEPILKSKPLSVTAKTTQDLKKKIEETHKVKVLHIHYPSEVAKPIVLIEKFENSSIETPQKINKTTDTLYKTYKACIEEYEKSATIKYAICHFDKEKLSFEYYLSKYDIDWLEKEVSNTSDIKFDGEEFVYWGTRYYLLKEDKSAKIFYAIDLDDRNFSFDLPKKSTLDFKNKRAITKPGDSAFSDTEWVNTDDIKLTKKITFDAKIIELMEGDVEYLNKIHAILEQRDKERSIYQIKFFTKTGADKPDKTTDQERRLTILKGQDIEKTILGKYSEEPLNIYQNGQTIFVLAKNLFATKDIPLNDKNYDKYAQCITKYLEKQRVIAEAERKVTEFAGALSATLQS